VKGKKKRRLDKEFTPRQLRAHHIIFFFCMTTILFDILCDFVVFILTTITNILSALHRLSRHLLIGDSLHHQLIRLQANRSALLIQKEDIPCQIAEIDMAIKHLTHLNPQPHTETHQTPLITSSVSDNQMVQQSITPLRNRR
jgi:hypothetical protein